MPRSEASNHCLNEVSVDEIPMISSGIIFFFLGISVKVKEKFAAKLTFNLNNFDLLRCNGNGKANK